MVGKGQTASSSPGVSAPPVSLPKLPWMVGGIGVRPREGKEENAPAYKR